MEAVTVRRRRHGGSRLFSRGENHPAGQTSPSVPPLSHSPASPCTASCCSGVGGALTGPRGRVTGPEPERQREGGRERKTPRRRTRTGDQGPHDGFREEGGATTTHITTTTVTRLRKGLDNRFMTTNKTRSRTRTETLTETETTTRLPRPRLKILSHREQNVLIEQFASLLNPLKSLESFTPAAKKRQLFFALVSK